MICSRYIKRSGITSLFTVIILVSCSGRKELSGFESTKWQEADPCSETRITLANEIEIRSKEIVGFTQVDIETLLGKAPRHQLGSRNEKQFYYPVTVDCEDGKENTSLYILFDALGRTKEVQVILD